MLASAAICEPTNNIESFHKIPQAAPPLPNNKHLARQGRWFAQRIRRKLTGFCPLGRNREICDDIAS